MKKRSKHAMLFMAATLMATPVWASEQSEAVAMNNFAEIDDTIPVPEDVSDVLEELETYLPAIVQLKIDGIRGDREGGYSVILSDKSNKLTVGKSLQFRMDASGNILELDWISPDRDKTNRLNPKRDYQKAVDFIRDQIPTSHFVSRQALISQRRGRSEDHLLVVPFYRTLNDVPVSKQWGQAFVDDEGQIVKFVRADGSLPASDSVVSPQKAVDAGKAQKVFEENAAMRLAYDRFSGKLVYIPDRLPLVDAVTGQLVPSLTVETSETILVNGKASQPAGRDQKMMETMLRNEAKLNVNLLEFKHETERDKRTDVDVYTWKRKVYQNATLTVDRKTRQPIELLIDGPAERERDKPLTSIEAKEMAVQFVQHYLLAQDQSFLLKQSFWAKEAPDWVEKNRIENTYEYRFYPEKNGIAAVEPDYTVKVDAKSGSIVHVHVSGEKSLPSQFDRQGLLEEQKAKQAFFAQKQVRLFYSYPKAYGQTAKLPQLVYGSFESGPFVMIDAISGAVEAGLAEWGE